MGSALKLFPGADEGAALAPGFERVNLRAPALPFDLMGPDSRRRRRLAVRFMPGRFRARSPAYKLVQPRLGRAASCVSYAQGIAVDSEAGYAVGR